MLLWHLGGTVAFIRYAFRDERMDLRVLMLGAVLPDLVDTPVGFLLWDRFRTARLAGHSLAATAAVMVAVLVLARRGRPRKRWMPLAIGMLMHLVLDAMWQSPATLWWPFLGGFTATPHPTPGAYVAAVLADPWMWLGEIVGGVYLVTLARRGRLGDRARLTRFLRTGRIDVPIGRDDRPVPDHPVGPEPHPEGEGDEE